MNLAETQNSVKKGILFTISAIFIFYLGKFAINQTYGLYLKINPPKIPEPAAAFGPLPQLKMTNVQIKGIPEYVLETVDGKLPRFSDRAYVYQVNQPQGTLLSEQRMKQLAQDLNFTSSFTKTSPSEFRWVDGVNSRTLNANVITKNFSLQTNTNKLGSVVSSVGSINNNDAQDMVMGFLKAKGLINQQDIETLSFRSVPSQVVIGQLKEVSKINPITKVMNVNVYRSIVEKISPEKENRYPVLGPNPRKSLIKFLVTNEGKVFRFPNIDFTYWDVNYNTKSDYYISPIQNVWATIVRGQGINTYIKPDNGDYYGEFSTLEIEKINIREIYVAYYEQEELAQYLQPIYVFEGQFITKPLPGQISQTGEIVIYFPAIRGDFVKSNQE
mgnify:CR=1 FL=1